MANRLDIDAHVLAYLGFDEANETDVALDESSYARHFTVYNSPAVIPARVNNGRQFNGSTTYASPADSAPFRIAGDFTFNGWVILDQVNSSGSMLRTILECSGAGATSDSNCLYGLYVSSAGAVVYRHETGTRTEVRLSSANGLIRAGRYYSIALVRTAIGGQQQLSLYVDNQPVPWSGSTGLVDAATGGSSSTLLIGKSSQLVDPAVWNGTIDEVSLHDVARSFQPYLRAAYYRLTLTNLFFKLTILNNVRSVGGSEMGGGSRWWVYERDNNLYAIRENTLGLFSSEVALTMGGIQPNGAVVSGNTEKPTVIYDSANDVLLIAFLSGGKIFKLTASIGDTPQTRVLPFTVDTAGIAKVRDSNESGRVGMGIGTVRPLALSYVNRQPIKLSTGDSGIVGFGGSGLGNERFRMSFYEDLGDGSSAPTTIQFTGWSSFGILIPWSNTYGYAVFSFVAGSEKLLGYVLAQTTDSIGRTNGYWYISSRVFGTWYYVKPLNKAGKIVRSRSNMIVDLLATMDFPLSQDRSENVLHYNIHGDDPSLAPLGFGGVPPITPRLTYVNRQPIKLSAADSGTVGMGIGLARFSITCTYNPITPQRKRWELP